MSRGVYYRQKSRELFRKLFLGVFPSLFSGLARNFLSALRREAGCPRLPAQASERHGGGILALICGHVRQLAGGDLADQHGGGVSVGRPVFALGTFRHFQSLDLLAGKHIIICG